MEKNNLAQEAEQKGSWLLQKLRAIDSPKIRDVRGLGLMIGIELKEKVKPYLQTLMDAGILALPAGATVLRLLPLTIQYHQLEIVVEKLKEIL